MPSPLSSLPNALSTSGAVAVSLFTPRQQISLLRQQKNYQGWEYFRDGLVRRWTNSNIMCGLIMGATSTVVFSNLEIGRVPLALGVASLLSSLLSIGFSVGHIYVLGDVDGRTLDKISDRYPRLFVYALAIPQLWAAISFGAFFLMISILGWQQTNKGVTPKLGIVGAGVITIGHLIAFALMLRSQHDPKRLIPGSTP